MLLKSYNSNSSKSVNLSTISAYFQFRRCGEEDKYGIRAVGRIKNK